MIVDKLQPVSAADRAQSQAAVLHLLNLVHVDLDPWAPDLEDQAKTGAEHWMPADRVRKLLS